MLAGSCPSGLRLCGRLGPSYGWHILWGGPLHPFADQFDFRYSNRVKLCIDDERTARALKGIVRKRLTYRMPHN